MSRINDIKLIHAKELEKQCRKNQVSFISVEKLLESEKTKKLLKRNALIQQTIDKEIENSIENEN
ncbi:MAG TPA: DNA modification system-associated small protein [Chitinophagaceae bacterium]|nr:DNA modification system-associated small protein [Chitinophagaceae bacterium]